MSSIHNIKQAQGSIKHNKWDKTFYEVYENIPMKLHVIAAQFDA